ncbi:host attachment family protein [Rhizobium calliandrae]|uniref:Host attachment family protein n=1 Tax=Rhizobium calliandrae TaxID=1312182 RepID=A0ABT7K768_9HYPH|nr:host attachment family protein [Rhizobium calliandrae]MDL2404440.1 host attachment family protein [Rhizobium calliandrae]
MVDIKFSRGTWVVVCDGAKALILKCSNGGQHPHLRTCETMEQPHPPDRELGADKPGRTHQAEGFAGSAVEETEWHEQAAAEFLKGVAAKIDALVQTKGIDRLILVAPPRALGVLRPHLGAHSQAVIVAEVAKDLTNFPVDQIERHLVA